MGLTAGAVPARVDAPVKAGLLDLVDHATRAGWSRRRACLLLGLDPDRVADWRGRRRYGRLCDGSPGGGPVHGLLPDERAVIVELFDGWGDVDRAHRKLAARGFRLGLVHVSASTMHRVLVAPKAPSRTVVHLANRRSAHHGRTGWCGSRTASGVTTSPHCTRARRGAVAVMDVVSRRWLATLVSAEETSVQIEVAFTDALHGEGLDERIDADLLAQLRAGEREPAELDGPDAGGVPVLIAMSDNGPQMRSHSTREFMAACAIMQRFGRPGTPTDQAWIESLFRHVKTDWPELEKIRDPSALDLELGPGPGPGSTPSGCMPGSASPGEVSSCVAGSPTASLTPGPIIASIPRSTLRA